MQGKLTITTKKLLRNKPNLSKFYKCLSCEVGMIKKMKIGLDMYVALPILSTYLGHKTIYATEQYIRLTMSLYPYIEKRFKDKMDKVFSEVSHEND